MLDSELKKQLDTIEKGLYELSRKPASGATMLTKGVDGGFNQNWRSDQWPAEKLKKLGDQYGAFGSALVNDMFARGTDKKLRLSGIGKHLVALADSRGHSTMYGGAYKDLDKLEKDFDLTTVEKANRVGYKGSNGQIIKTALAENSGQTGGYIVPPQFMNELLTIAAEDGFIEPRAKVIPMNSRTMQIPMLDITSVQATGTSPYFGGILATWQPEAQTISETEPAFRQSEWTAWDLELYSVSSNQLLADNGIGLDALMTQLFGQAITWYKEYAFLQGKGSGSTMPLGILNAPATLAQNRAVSSRFVLADAAAMLSHLQVRSWDDACWIMHQSVIPQLIQMASGAVANSASTTYIPGNQLVWAGPNNNPMTQKLPTAFLNGLPIFFTEKLPSLGTKGDVMLVDWSKYVIGQRLEMQIDVSPHYLFRNNQLAWRVVARCDGRPWLNSFISDAAGWQISPYIVLN